MTHRLMLVALCLAAFAGVLNAAALAPFFPVLSEEFEVSIAALGQVVMTSLLLSATLALVVGPLADHFGHRRVMLVGAGAAMVAAFGVALSTSYSMLLLTRLPSGIAAAILTAVSVAIAATRFPEDQRRRAMSWTVASVAGTPIIGILAVTTIGDAFGWRVSFAVLGGLATLAFVLLWLAVTPDSPIPATPFRVGDVLVAYAPILRDESSLLLYAGELTRSLCWVAYLTYLPSFLIPRYDLTLQQFGLIMVMPGLAFMLGTRLGAGPLSRWGLHRAYAASIMLLGGAITTVLVVPVSLPVAVAIVTLGSFPSGSGLVTLTVLISERSPTGRATAMMLRSVCFSLGAATGAALGGGLLILGGFATLGIGLLGVATLSSMIVWRSNRAARPATVSLATEPK
jgi:predicted MFS family arabinose efflux permease